MSYHWTRCGSGHRVEEVSERFMWLPVSVHAVYIIGALRDTFVVGGGDRPHALSHESNLRPIFNFDCNLFIKSSSSMCVDTADM